MCGGEDSECLRALHIHLAAEHGEFLAALVVEFARLFPIAQLFHAVFHRVAHAIHSILYAHMLVSLLGSMGKYKGDAGMAL